MNNRYYYPGLNSNEACAVAPDYDKALRIFAKEMHWRVSDVRGDLLDIGEPLFKGGADDREIGYYGR